MRAIATALAPWALCLLTGAAPAQEVFNVPIRIAMGKLETEDSHGRVWLGDGPGPGDPLAIRPNDAGGTNTAENWSLGNLKPESMTALGFDPNHPGDLYLLNSIRWDNGADSAHFRLEIPIPNGEYLVNLYFNEQCCPNRHFKIELQGEIADNDVSYADYRPGGPPTLGWLGRLSFPGVVVTDKLLRVGLLPCPECPGATDTNAIIDLLEVLSGPGCDHQGLDFNCAYDEATGEVTGTWNAQAGAEGYRLLRNGAPFGPDLGPDDAATFTDATDAGRGLVPEYTLQVLDGGVPTASCKCAVRTFRCPRDLVCTSPPDSDEAALSWTGPSAGLVTGYEVRRNGALVATLPGSAISYEDTSGTRLVDYEVTPLTDPPGTCPPMRCSVALEGVPFAIPLRINMGGAETVDSKGQTWLGDGPGAGDRLGIRPEDLSGTNWIENWSIGSFIPDSFTALGFNPTHPGDRYIFNTIRWDLGADGIDFRIKLTVPSEKYLVNLYFNEGCCTNRHFKIELQGTVVDEDVSYLDYDAVNPGIGRLGRISFLGVEVTDGFLQIGLLPCPDCVGGGDNNAIINAIEVLPGVCVPGFRQCPRNLACTTDAAGSVDAIWEGPLCLDLTGYEVRRDGEVLMNLPATATSFSDRIESRTAFYELVPKTAAGVAPCDPLGCLAFAEGLPFAVPLRINMGGRSAVDSRGRPWVGDGPGAGDPLAIRPDDFSGTNWIENWCPYAALSEADSMLSLGFDPTHAGDRYIMNTIRWDLGNDFIDYRLELPVRNGFYQVSLYFTECCCTQRHFQVEIQGEILDNDVSYLDYDATKPALGRTGRLLFDGVEVFDEVLRIGLLPCPACPDPLPVDTNAILSAIEVLPADTTIVGCPRGLAMSLGADGRAHGTWTPGENVALTGYDLYRDGVKIGSLGPAATEFTDEPPCQQSTVYELAPLSAAPDFLCPGMRIRGRLANPACPFIAPVRINMGGVETVDSHGNVWLGDGPGPGDPLSIRPDDAGGANFIENWSIGVFQPDALAALGFDPTHLGDRYIFNTIRWDDAGRPGDFRLDIPLENGEYTVNMYFNEGCCTNRHFKIEIQGEIADDDVSYLDYDPAPALGKVGRLSFPGVPVEDQHLRLALLPCPACVGGGDNNAIINALEILAFTEGVPRPTDLVARAGDGKVDLSWTAPVPAPAGYNVYRSATAGGPYEKLNPAVVAAPLYSDAGLVNGTPYCYVVRSVGAGDRESRNSNEACATPSRTGPTFRRGDVNVDGKIDVTDPVNLLGFLFLGQGKPECLDAGDTDDSGLADISDAVSNLGYQFLGAAPPASPGPTDCGLDQSPEVPDLGCDVSCR